MLTEYPLDAKNIDICAELVETHCKSLQMSERDALKYRLSVEEVLGSWAGAGFDAFALDTDKRRIQLSARGASRDPFAAEDEDSLLLRGLRTGQLHAPKYAYRRGRNTVTWRIPKKHINPVLQLALSIALGVILGIALKLLPGESVRDALLVNLIDPVYNAAFRLLGYISGPMILLSVIWGIYGIGDADTFGRLGKRLMLSCLAAIFGVAFCFMFTFPLCGMHLAGGTSAGSAFGSILGMILDIVPADIVSPFVSGNTLQIIFTAVVLGVAMLLMGKRAQAVGELVEQTNEIVQFTMNAVGRLIPAFITIIVARLILTDTVSAAGALWKFILLLLGSLTALAALLTAFTSIYVRVSPLALVKKCVPALLITITTGSSAACLSTSVDICERKFGIDHRLVGFGLPLCTVLLKLGTTVYLLIASFFFGRFSGIECSIGWLITAAITSALLSVAIPPVTGGGVVTYTVLFAQLGIPSDMLTVVISLDALVDFLDTTVNVYTTQLLLLCVGHGMGMVDRDALRHQN